MVFKIMEKIQRMRKINVWYKSFGVICWNLAVSLAAQDLSSQSGYIQVKNGSLFYQKFGSGEPIVVLHGGPGKDQGYLLPQMLELSKDHELIFYDQRGSGQSLTTPLDAEHINTDQFVEDLEALRLALGLEKITLLGYSWGGFLALCYAIKYPQTLSSLILMSCAPVDYKGQLAFTVEEAKRCIPIATEIAPLTNFQLFEQLSEQQINALYRTLFSVYVYNPADVQKLTLTMNPKSAQNGFKVAEELCKTFWLQPSTNLFPVLKTIQVPTLLLHGKQDIVPLHTAQEINDALPNSRIIVIDECGHFPYIEKPEMFFAHIRSFLQNLNG